MEEIPAHIGRNTSTHWMKYNFTLEENSQTQNMTKLKKSKCDKTQQKKTSNWTKLRMWQNSKTINLTTQKHKMWQNTQKKTKNLTKFKSLKCEKI